MRQLQTKTQISSRIFFCSMRTPFRLRSVPTLPFPPHPSQFGNSNAIGNWIYLIGVLSCSPEPAAFSSYLRGDGGGCARGRSGGGKGRGKKKAADGVCSTFCARPPAPAAAPASASTLCSQTDDCHCLALKRLDIINPRKKALKKKAG